MYFIYQNNFGVQSRKELNDFILKILNTSVSYIKFLIFKNKIYLPDHIEPKDAAVDLIAELFIEEKGVLIRFKDFFDNNINRELIKNNEDFEHYLRGFIYTVIQNNLNNLYKQNDPFTYNIIRNIKEAVKSLNYYVSIHFSDKYIHSIPEIDFKKNLPEREDLFSIVHSYNIFKNLQNSCNFIKSIFELLESYSDFAHALRFSDLVAVYKSVIVFEYSIRNGENTESDYLTERINVKFVLEDVRCTFSEKLQKYIIKNKLSQNFKESMYNVIDEIIHDVNAGNVRKSIMELMKLHFQSCDKYLFYKVQYCVELFEGEIVKCINKEKTLIG